MTPQEHEWKVIRRRILKRDRYRCRVFECTQKGASNLSIHHIVPRSKGGGDNDENLITLCNKHHDEIEIAEIEFRSLIESWESDTDPLIFTAGETSTILDATQAQSDKRVPKSTNNGETKPSRHICRPSTVNTLVSLLEESTLSDVCNHLRYPPQFASTISAIVRKKPGAISLEREDELRKRMGLVSVSHERMAQRILERTSRTPVIVKREKIDIQKILDANPPKAQGSFRESGMKPRTATQETVDAIIACRDKYGSLNSAARAIATDNFGAILGGMSNAINGKSMTVGRENILRTALGIATIPRVAMVSICPIHGIPHIADCDGKPGVATWVRKGERIIAKPGFGKPRKERKTIQLSPEAYAIMVEWRERIGGDWYETVRAMDYLARGVAR